MEIPKPTEDDRARFTALVPNDSRVEIKPMFGNLGAFVNGKMFMGLFGFAVGLKLSPEDLTALAAQPGSGPFGPSERPMGGYATLPPHMAPHSVKAWTAKALEHVASLPPKNPNLRSRPEKRSTRTSDEFAA